MGKSLFETHGQLLRGTVVTSGALGIVIPTGDGTMTMVFRGVKVVSALDDVVVCGT